MYGGQNSVPLTSLEHQLWARPLPEELQAVGEQVYYTRTRLWSVTSRAGTATWAPGGAQRRRLLGGGTCPRGVFREKAVAREQSRGRECVLMVPVLTANRTENPLPARP